MGLLKRLQRLTVSRIETFLSSMEDPELLFPQLVREMEDQVRAATEGEAKSMAAVKTSEKDLAAVSGKLERMRKGAELALDKGDEATAREAINAQIGLEKDVQTKETAVARSKELLEEARNARRQIQSQLEELRAKKDEILSRARVAKTRKKVEKTVSGPADSSRSILDAVSRLEGKVEESEAELEVRREMGQEKGQSLDKRLAELESADTVEQRLAALRKKVKSSDKK